MLKDMKLMKCCNDIYELRPYDRKVLEKSLKWLNDPDLQKGMDIGYTITKEGQEEWYSRLSFRNDYKIWGFYCGDTSIGAGGFRNIREESGELTYYIGEKSYWGKGLGKVLMMQLLEKAQEMGFRYVKTKVLHSNERSLGCCRSIGFTVTGKDEKFTIMTFEIN